MMQRWFILIAVILIVMVAAEARRGRRPGRGGATMATVYSMAGCATCRAQERILDLLPARVGAQIQRVDLGADPDEARRLGIRSVPTTAFRDSSGDVVALRRGIVDVLEFEAVLDPTGAESGGRRAAMLSDEGFDLKRYF